MSGKQTSGIYGIAFMIAGMAVMPFSDALSKHLVGNYDATQITWLRYMSQTCIVVPFVLYSGGFKGFRMGSFPVQITRGICMAAATILYIESLKTLPLSNAMATVFLFPLIVTAVSPFLLGEKIGPRRIVSVVAGFLGALLVIQPGTDVFQVGSLYAAGAAVTYVGYVVLTRKHAGMCSSSMMLLAPSLLGVVVLSPFVPQNWTPPSQTDLFLALGIGIIAALAHFLVILAYKFGEAPVVVPFAYSQIVMGTVLGYIVFGDFPDVITSLGITVVIASGVYISVRERASRPVFRDIRRRP